MTVGELRALLACFPENALVLTHGYEDNWDAITQATAGAAEKVNGAPWYMGDYKPAAMGQNVVYLSTDDEPG